MPKPRQYYAISTYGGDDWWILTTGPTARGVEDEAIAKICVPPAWPEDIHAQTERRNLHVVTATMGKRRFGRGWEFMLDDYYNGLTEEVDPMNALHEQHIYRLTHNGEEIEVVAFPGGADGWVLYTYTEWEVDDDATTTADYEVDPDGEVTFQGERIGLSAADLEDTGREIAATPTGWGPWPVA